MSKCIREGRGGGGGVLEIRAFFFLFLVFALVGEEGKGRFLAWEGV